MARITLKNILFNGSGGLSWLVIAGCLWGLSGCFAGFVATGAAGTGLIVYDKRSVDTIKADLRIAYDIHNAMRANKSLAASRIVVVSFNRAVLLLGEVRNTSTKTLIDSIAQRTPEVHRVYDEIGIGNPISLQKRAQDSLVTAEVRSHLILEKGLQSGLIRVVTENGIVYLMGSVTPSQALMAVDVARQVRGVRKVVKVFQ